MTGTNQRLLRMSAEKGAYGRDGWGEHKAERSSTKQGSEQGPLSHRVWVQMLALPLHPV